MYTSRLPPEDFTEPNVNEVIHYVAAQFAPAGECLLLSIPLVSIHGPYGLTVSPVLMGAEPFQAPFDNRPPRLTAAPWNPVRHALHCIYDTVVIIFQAKNENWGKQNLRKKWDLHGVY